MSQEQILDISWGAIVKVFIAIFIFYIIYLAREIAMWFLFALAISILLDPAINFFRKIHIPRVIAIMIVYLSIFGILGILIYLSAPIFISEIRQFIQQLPGYFEQINPVLRQFGLDTAQNFGDFTNTVTSNLQQSSQGIIKAIMVFFGGIASAVSILTMSFFLSLEENSVERVLLLLSPVKYEEHIKNIFERVQKKSCRMVFGKIASLSFCWNSFLYCFLFIWSKIRLCFGFAFGVFEFYSIYWTMDNEHFIDYSYCSFNRFLDDGSLCFGCYYFGAGNRK